MSEPKRYRHHKHFCGLMKESDGEWVKWEDYARLKAEVERLTEIIRRECDGGVDLREEAQRTIEENHKLRAEVERLRKDGEMMDRERMSDEYDLNNQTRIINGLLKDKERLNAEVETIRKDRELLFADHKVALASIQRLNWELQTAKEGKNT